MAWIDEARHHIDVVHKGLPESATLDDRRRALKAYPAWRFHGGTSWGQKIWLKARKEYLAKYGRPKTDAAVPSRHLSPLERLMAASGASK